MPESAPIHGQPERRKQREQARGTPAERGYDYEWSKVSARIRREEPVCQICNDAPSEDVDHIIEFQGIDDPLRMDRNNLRAVCRACHNKKTHGRK